MSNEKSVTQKSQRAAHCFSHTCCWKCGRSKRWIRPVANLCLPFETLLYPLSPPTSWQFDLCVNICPAGTCVCVCPWVRTPNVRLCMYPCMYFSRPGAINKPLVRHFCPKRPIEITAAHLSGKCVPLGVILWLRGRPIALSRSLALCVKLSHTKNEKLSPAGWTHTISAVRSHHVML